MSLLERLQTMELIWDSLRHDLEEAPSPDWHEAVLASHLATIKSGEAKFLTVAQLKQRRQTNS
jgi:hypothetical protein